MKSLPSGRYAGAGYICIVASTLLLPASFEAGAEAAGLAIQQSTGGDTEDGSALDPEAGVLPVTDPRVARRDRPVETMAVLRPRASNLSSVPTSSFGLPVTSGRDILIPIRHSSEQPEIPTGGQMSMPALWRRADPDPSHPKETRAIRFAPAAYVTVKKNRIATNGKE